MSLLIFLVWVVLFGLPLSVMLWKEVFPASGWTAEDEEKRKVKAKKMGF